MRRFLGAVTLLLALTSIAVATNAPPIAKPTLETTRVWIGKAGPFMLEMAVTPKTRELGLMHRTTLAPHDGMVFLFPKSALYKFWMKNTLIPLDMLFVDEAGTVIYIATATPLSLEMVGPDIAVDTVIELAGGRSAREGITVGDKVRYATKIHPRTLAR